MKTSLKALRVFCRDSLVMALSFGLVCGPYSMADEYPNPQGPPREEVTQQATRQQDTAKQEYKYGAKDVAPAPKQGVHQGRPSKVQAEKAVKVAGPVVVPFYDYQNCDGVVADAAGYCPAGSKFGPLALRMNTGRDSIINACSASQRTNIEKAKKFRKAARSGHALAENYLEERLKDIDAEIKDLEKSVAKTNLEVEQQELLRRQEYRASLEARYKDAFQNLGVAQQNYQMCKEHAFAAFNEGVKLQGFYHGTQFAYVKNPAACVAEFQRAGSKFFDPSTPVAPPDIGSWHRRIRGEYNLHMKDTSEAYEIYKECAAEQAGGMHQPAESLQKAMKQEKIKKILLGIGITAGVLAILCFVFKLGPCKKDDSKEKKKKTKKPKPTKTPTPHHPEPTPTPTGAEIIDPRGPRNSSSDPAGAATGANSRPSQTGAGTASNGTTNRNTNSGQAGGATGTASRGTQSGTGTDASGSATRGTQSGQTGGAGDRNTGSTVRPPVGR